MKALSIINNFIRESLQLFGGGGEAIVSLDTTSPWPPLSYNNEGKRRISSSSHYKPVLDFTLKQDAAKQLHYPELSGESLRLKNLFQFSLEQITEVIDLGERLSNVQIDKFSLFFELPGSFKNIVPFWDFSL